MADAEIARSNIAALPPFPDTLRLLAAARSTNWARELLDEIESDRPAAQALAALAGAEPGSANRAAIEKLGRQAASVILIQRLYRHFLILASTRISDIRPLCELVRHSITVGVMAERIVRGTSSTAVDAGDAFLAGAMHDLGKFVLATVYPKSYERFLTPRRQSDGLAQEQRQLGVDHCAAGAWVAETWGIPPPFCDAIRLHHFAGDLAIPSPGHAPLVAVVRSANAMTHESGAAFGEPARASELDPAWEIAGLQRRDVTALMEGVDAVVAQWMSALGFDEPILPATLAGWAVDAVARSTRRIRELEGRSSTTAGVESLAGALTHFDQHFNARGGLAAVAALMLESSQRMWPAAARAVITAGGNDLVAIAARETTDGRSASVLQRGDECSNWLASRAAAGPLDARGRRLLAAGGVAIRDDEALVLAPIRRCERTLGGVLLGERAGAGLQPLLAEAPAAALLTRFAAALAEVAAQAQSQRLADDLTETNRRLQRAQGEILRSRALSMIAELAGGAGHELNNPLSVISGRAELLLRDVDPDSEAHRSLAQIQAKAHECSRIVSQLMDFAIPRAPQFTDCAPADVFAAVQAAWRDRTMPASIRVEFELDPGAAATRCRARADAGQVASAVGELIQNGIDAMHDRPGAVRVAVRLADRSPLMTEARPAVAGVLEIVVSDSGCGMSASVLQRAFDPFFSHRVAGRGRGLGLARAYRVVESHGGRIWLDSRPGEGTRAFVQIPLVE